VAQVGSDSDTGARSANVDRLLTQAAKAIESRRLGLAFHAYRQAADLSVGSEVLRRRVFDQLVDGAGTVTGDDWRMAESLLRLAEGLHVGRHAPAEIWQPIERQLSEEYIRNVLADANRSESIENLQQLRGRLVYALHRYPAEQRLTSRLQLVDRALEALPATIPPAPPLSAKPIVPAPLPAIVEKTVWSRVRAFGIVAAMLLLSIGVFFSARSKRPVVKPDEAAKTYSIPPLPEKKAPAPSVAETVVKVRLSDKKRTAILIPKDPLPVPSDFIADEHLAQLQWNNLEASRQIEEAEKTLHERIESREKARLAAVARVEQARKESERALTQLRSREIDKASNAVSVMLQRYVNAWNTKDVERITALHRTLNRRTVKEQLDPVTAIRMTIVPASTPQIDGERATVLCRRQVEETFSDGTEKQSPALLVTFTLSLLDVDW
jgi:hypothetical protein